MQEHIPGFRSVAEAEKWLAGKGRQTWLRARVPEVFPHLIPYLKSRGVEVKLNATGWIDWPS
jgi:hypothetical protein